MAPIDELPTGFEIDPLPPGFILDAPSASIVDSQPPKQPTFLGGPEATISATPDTWTNRISSSFRDFFGGSQSPVYQNDKGEYIQPSYNPKTGKIDTIPEFSTQESARRASTGMGMLASLLPGVAAAKLPMAAAFLPGTASKIPEAVKLLGRVVGNYLPTALATSGAGLAADTVSQMRGDMPETSPQEDYQRLAIETGIGAGIPTAVEAAQPVFSKVEKLGNYLKGKLSGTVIPEQVIPEQVIPRQEIPYSPWKPPATFAETYTPATRAKDLSASGRPDLSAPKILSRREKAILANKPLTELPPEKSLTAIETKKLALEKEAGELAKDAPSLPPTVPARKEKIIESGPKVTGFGPPPKLKEKIIEVPARWEVPTPSVDDFLERAAATDAALTARQTVDQEVGTFAASWDGSMYDLHKFRQQLSQKNQARWKSSDKSVLDQAMLKLENDVSTILRENVAGYKNVNSQISDLRRIIPIAQKRASTFRQRADAPPPVKYKTIPEKIIPEQRIPEQRIPGAWQGPVDTAAKVIIGGKLGGLTGAVAGALVPNMGISSLLGKTAGALGALPGAIGRDVAGVAPVAASLVNRAIEAGLTRNTDQFGDDQLAMFLMKTASTSQATIAQDLVKKFQKAKKDGDITTVEKLHGDMARLFPDFFEPGQGVNGKLFYQDEQAKAMDLLKELHRLGQVDSIQLAKQKNAFNNSQDGRLLPVTIKRHQYGAPTNSFVNGTRTYPY